MNWFSPFGTTWLGGQGQKKFVNSKIFRKINITFICKPWKTCLLFKIIKCSKIKHQFYVIFSMIFSTKYGILSKYLSVSGQIAQQIGRKWTWTSNIARGRSTFFLNYLDRQLIKTRVKVEYTININCCQIRYFNNLTLFIATFIFRIKMVYFEQI